MHGSTPFCVSPATASCLHAAQRSYEQASTDVFKQCDAASATAFPAVSLSQARLYTMQGEVEGGFMGRTNKLVDGCYSFWQGGLFPLLRMLQPDIMAQSGIPHSPPHIPTPDCASLELTAKVHQASEAASGPASSAASQDQPTDLVSRARRAADAAQVSASHPLSSPGSGQLAVFIYMCSIVYLLVCPYPTVFFF